MKQLGYWLAIVALAVLLAGVGAFSGCLIGLAATAKTGKGIEDPNGGQPITVGLIVGGAVGAIAAFLVGRRFRPKD